MTPIVSNQMKSGLKAAAVPSDAPRLRRTELTRAAPATCSRNVSDAGSIVVAE